MINEDPFSPETYGHYKIPLVLFSLIIGEGTTQKARHIQ